MQKKRFQSRNISRWIAIGLVFCVAAGFAFVTFSNDSPIETSSERTAETSPPEAPSPTSPKPSSDLAEPQPTLPFEITEVQNKAPKIQLEDLDCWTEMPDSSDVVRVQLMVEDSDDETLILDIGVLIEERIIDLSDSISPSTKLIGSGNAQAIFPLPPDVKNYVHIIAHVTDSSGAKSEAALILPQSNGDCDSG